MLSRSIRVLNFDNSVIKQTSLLSKYESRVVDLNDLGPKARLWMNKKIKKTIEERLQDTPTAAVTFLGSGDFHHISQILINQINEPLCLFVFDLHPDWDIFPPAYGCGSWVSRSLENMNIIKCILIGVSSDDISSGYLQSGNLTSLKGNRVEIYPYLHKPSLTFLRRIPENISIKTVGGRFKSKIYWQELKDKDISGFFHSLVERIPLKKAYVSIDKDCLNKKHALTNWEEGYLSLDQLLLMLKIIKDNFDIAGMDITGDYSKISLGSKCKTFFSKIDHPKKMAADDLAESTITAINQETNLKILETVYS